MSAQEHLEKAAEHAQAAEAMLAQGHTARQWKELTGAGMMHATLALYHQREAERG